MSNLQMIVELEGLNELQAAIIKVLAARLAELGDTETGRDEIAQADQRFARLISPESEPFEM